MKLKGRFETQAVLGYPFNPGFIVCVPLESTMVVLGHFIRYKALLYTQHMSGTALKDSDF